MIAPPKESMASKPKKTTEKAKFSAARLIVWGVVILLALAAVFAYFAFFAANKGTVESASAKATADERGTGKRVAPKAAATNKVKNRDRGATRPTNVADNKAKRVVEAEQVAEVKPKRVFTNAADQVLALAMDIRPGMDMPPLPPGATAGMTKEQLKAMFSADIVIDDDDPENIKELKLRVKGAREAMLERIEAGENFDDVLGEHRRMVNENAAVYRQCEDDLRKIIAEGDEQSAIEYRETVNKALNNMGIDGLIVPITAEEHEEFKLIRRERHRARMEKRRKPLKRRNLLNENGNYCFVRNNGKKKKQNRN